MNALRAAAHRVRARIASTSHDTRILLMAIASGLPGSAITLWLIWRGEYTLKVQWTVSVFLVAVWLGFAFSLRKRVVFPLQTLSNLLAALREGDYSIRARAGRRDDALARVMMEVNTLSETLTNRQMLDIPRSLRRVGH